MDSLYSPEFAYQYQLYRAREIPLIGVSSGDQRVLLLVVATFATFFLFVPFYPTSYTTFQRTNDLVRSKID